MTNQIRELDYKTANQSGEFNCKMVNLYREFDYKMPNHIIEFNYWSVESDKPSVTVALQLSRVIVDGGGRRGWIS